MDKLRICAWSGIIFLALSFAYLVAAIIVSPQQHLFILMDFIDLAFAMIAPLFLAGYAYGFALVGRKMGPGWARIGGLMLFSSLIAVMLIELLTFAAFSWMSDSFLSVLTFLAMLYFAAGCIVFGIGLKKHAERTLFMTIVSWWSILFGSFIAISIPINIFFEQLTMPFLSAFLIGFAFDFVMKVLLMFNMSRMEAKAEIVDSKNKK